MFHMVLVSEMSVQGLLIICNTPLEPHLCIEDERNLHAADLSCISRFEACMVAFSRVHVELHLPIVDL
jgi:hypothetical protein